jgi:predicted GNAT family acetyltransferase
MENNFNDIPLLNDAARKRFSIQVNGYTAYVEYEVMGDQIALVHTEADAALKGTGAAGALIEKVLQYIRQNHQTVAPYCPFAFAYIKKHPEWKSLVDASFPGINQL